MEFGIKKYLYKYPSVVELSNKNNFFSNSGYSFVEDETMDKIQCEIPSPWHGRSVCILRNDNKWIIIKGAGCPYLSIPYEKTPENKNRYWGMINKEDCYREYLMMEKVSNMGIKTSIFSSINKIIGDFGTHIQPYNLIYTLENPLRLIDLDFLNHKKKNLVKNKLTDNSKFDEVHLTVTDFISNQIYILYTNGVVHNALSTHNITLSLELIDFESSFEKKTYGEKTFRSLIPRELIHLREIAFSLSCWFNEKYNVTEVDRIIKSKNFYKFL